jgi:hypothetical protein
LEKSSTSGVPSITGCSPIDPAVLKCDEVAYSDETEEVEVKERVEKSMEEAEVEEGGKLTR